LYFYSNTFGSYSQLIIYKTNSIKNLIKILAAAAVGIAGGSLLVLLFAPDKGVETRKKISKKRGTIFHKLKGDISKEKMAKLKGKLEAQLQKVNTKIAEISKEDYYKYV